MKAEAQTAGDKKRGSKVKPVKPEIHRLATLREKNREEEAQREMQQWFSG